MNYLDISEINSDIVSQKEGYLMYMYMVTVFIHVYVNV